MSVKPELTLSCLKESKKFQFGECPIGTFVVRLYWENYSKYIKSDRKLDGVYLLYDNKLNYGRICQFAITSLESLEYLVANCVQATGNKFKWFRQQTNHALMLFRGFAKTGYQFIKPIKVAVQSVVNTVKKAIVNTAKTVVEIAKSIVRRFDPRQPQSFAKCTTLEQAKYLFDRRPIAQRTQKFIDNYLATCDRISPLVESVDFQFQLIDAPTTFNLADLIPAQVQQPVIGLSLDDVVQVNYVPGEVQMEAAVVKHIPASESQVRKMMAEGFRLNQRRCKQWIIGVGSSIPGYQVLVKGSDKRTAAKIMEQVIENILLAELSVSELRDIIAVG